MGRTAAARLDVVATHLAPARRPAGRAAPAAASPARKILAGVKVVELATVVAGPTTAAMLGDLGADVVKVENPTRPDEARGFGHRNTPDKQPSMDGPFQQFNRGKRGVALDLQTPEGVALMKRLLATADVFVTNVRLPALQRLGLDYASVKGEFPALVYAQLSAWGLKGEMAKDAGYDYGAFWSYTGYADIIRPSEEADMPRFPGAVGDTMTAMQLVGGVALALLDRVRTGRGQFVDAALVRSGIFALSDPIMQHASGHTGAVRAKRATMQVGKRRTGLTSGCFRCADGKWVYLLGGEQHRHWDKTMAALGVARHHFGDPAGKAAPRPEWRAATAAVDAIVATKPYAEWHAIFKAHDVWHAPVNRFEDMYDDQQANDIGAFVEVPGVRHKLIAMPVQLSSQEGLGGPKMGAPTLGEHTAEVLGELGLGASEVARLREKGVVK